MGRTATSVRNPDLVVAIDGAALTAPDGTEYIIRAGQTFRASDVVARTWPHMFLDWPVSDVELEQERNKLYFGREVNSGK